MTLISIVSSCLNEAENVDELHRRVRAQFEPGGPSASGSARPSSVGKPIAQSS